MIKSKMFIISVCCAALVSSGGGWYLANTTNQSPPPESPKAMSMQRQTQVKNGASALQQTNQQYLNSVFSKRLNEGSAIIKSQESVKSSNELLANNLSVPRNAADQSLSISQQLSRRIEFATAPLRKNFASAELRRTKTTVQEFEGFTKVRVVIQRPSEEELKTAHQLMTKQERNVKPGDLSAYKLEAQKMLDDYTHFGNSTHRVLVLNTIASPTPGDPGIIYWEFDTNQPDQFIISESGKLITPSNVHATRPKKWMEDWVPVQRYQHHFKPL
jgi:hypothetical protein